MGNCLAMEEKVIKIMRNDGKVLQYREPINVHHILTQFSGHSLFENNTFHHQLLNPNAKLYSGHLYYLLPTKMIKKKIKKVTFASPEVEEDDSNIKKDDNKNVNVVRMKIIVHKQELEKLLQGGMVNEMMYQTIEKQVLLTNDDDVGDNLDCNGRWRPALECIVESE